MVCFSIDDIKEEIEILNIKKKKAEFILEYLVSVKPIRWKERKQEIINEIKFLDDSLYLAYTKLDNLFNYR